ncbi:MAG: tRNA (adenosine(37)-N6)-threonylcarbamoyltransferase complex dimerization subunit type 1 TsaB [Planctomycetia bacterium]|nr:tRNA (adenosine(37)-N6)-threonylcarbamoyltransferase complex dimerization subunit type 1 TsaB [Planctomycetia bacterium]
MKLLAIETTGVSGSVALSVDGVIVKSLTLDTERRSAQTLAPAISDILGEVGWNSKSIEAVALAIGPGSFTGLRVGVATAQLFAWAVNAKVLAIDTLDVIAAQLHHSPSVERDRVVSIGLDAQRGDVAVREYWLGQDAPWRITRAYRIESCAAWLDLSRAFPYSSVSRSEFAAASVPELLRDESVLTRLFAASKSESLFCGDTLQRAKQKGLATEAHLLAAPEFQHASAEGVSLAAWRRIEKGDFDDYAQLLPVYTRLASAEEKRIANLAKNR